MILPGKTIQFGFQSADHKIMFLAFVDDIIVFPIFIFLEFGIFWLYPYPTIMKDLRRYPCWFSRCAINITVTINGCQNPIIFS
jgi:hypothetical protein